MKPLLRRFLIGTTVLVSLGVLLLAWFALLIVQVDHELIFDRPSPTGRYVAEVHGVDYGQGSYSWLLLLRDRSAIALPKIDGLPPGEEIGLNVVARPERLYWDGETTLVILYPADESPPELERTEWGGVRIETRAIEHQP